MTNHLVPRADLTFKKILGEHESLVISLLNASKAFEAQSGKGIQTII